MQRRWRYCTCPTGAFSDIDDTQLRRYTDIDIVDPAVDEEDPDPSACDFPAVEVATRRSPSATGDRASRVRNLR